MTKRARRRAWLAALWGAAFGLGFGCHDDGGSSSQVLTGRIDTTGVVAIRAVSGTDVVTAAQVRSDGQFRIALPAGGTYRFEVLTSSGVRQVLAHRGGTWRGLEVKVCVPSDPFDLGTVGDSGTMCDPSDPNCPAGCGDEPPCTDPMDPNCKPPEPCSDPMDPGCQPPPCGGPNEPPCPCMDPMDPNCKPPEPCNDPMDPDCQPPPPPACGGPNEPPCPCMDPTDPNCKPPDPCSDPTSPDCMGCWPGDPNCGTTPPDCEDPMDPQTCKDPCVIDPMQCGCTDTEPNCWPPPEPPMCTGTNDTMCDPGDTVTPSNVPDDFGCMGFLDK